MRAGEPGDRLAVRGEHQPPAAAVVERPAQGLRQLADLHVQGGLGDVQIGGGAGEIEVIGEHHERRQGIGGDRPLIHSWKL